MLALLTLETLLFVLLAVAAGRPRRAPSRGVRLALAAVLAALTVTAGVAWGGRLGDSAQAAQELRDEIPELGRDAYVTSDACRACHQEQHASWHESFHRTMTQVAAPESVVPPWHGELESRGWRYRLFRRGEEYWAELPDPDWARAERLAGRDVDRRPDPPRVERRVVMTTGSHHMQTYWVPSESGREVYNLPFVYLFDDRRWVPREDVFLRPPNAGRLVGLWNNSCIECHSTGGAVGFDFEHEVFESQVAEMGISCEACHGPAEEHVAANRDPVRRYRLRSEDATDPTIVQPARLDHERSTYVCGQCHGVWMAEDPERWLAEGHPYRPGDDLAETRFLVRPARDRNHPKLRELVSRYPDALASRFWSDGMVRVSGRDMSGMIESPCYQPGELSCLTCHSMHGYEDTADQLAPGMRTNAACTQCHGELAGAAALTRHTRHTAGSAGSSCYNCHMPRTVYGLLTAIRSHQIDSPSIAASLDTGRPNACNLCHLDRSLGWAARELETGWGVARPALTAEQETVSAALLWLLTGDAGQRALVAWHLGWQPAQEVSGTGWLAPYLGHLLADPYAAVRYVAHHALTTLPGWETLPYDYVAPPAELSAARAEVIERWLDEHPRPPDRSGPAVLTDDQGDLLLAEIARLAARRDDIPVSLEE